MNKYTFTDNGHTFKRITKKRTKAAYNNGLSVILCPVNLRPGHPYHPEITISNKSNVSFENAINAFESYNIKNSETGRYAAFYIPVRKTDRFTGDVPTAATLGTIKEYDYSFLNVY